MIFSSPRLFILLTVLGLASSAYGVTTKSKRHTAAAKTSAPARSTTARRSTAARAAAVSTSKKLTPGAHRARLLASTHTPASHLAARRNARRAAWSPWTEPTFADSTVGDFIDGDDMVVRRAAVDALGPYNGTVVVADPTNGRVLTMVNQRVALKSGFQPCSTIKVVAALAGLTEGVIDRNTAYRIGGRSRMGLTDALAHSNNPYFASIGERLGFEKVSHYARLYGLGEKAGLNIPGEEAGTLPDSTPGEGMGMMTSFGSGISLTPLQLAALMSSIANGGTLYYLQYPRNQVEVDHFVPRVKRQLDIAPLIPEIRPGMLGAVEFGTARRAGYAIDDQTVAGKTGTCTDTKSPTHLGWFGSFNEVGKKKLVVVVLLTGGKGVSGPVASGVAGNVYKNLAKTNFFQQDKAGSPVALLSTQICCSVRAGN